MVVVNKVDRGVYSLRGWLAFVSLMDIGTALRAVFHKDYFLGSKFFHHYEGTDSIEVRVPDTTSRLLCFYSILNAMCLLHCALCIHHLAVLSVTACVLLLKVIYLLSEAFYYRTTPCSFHIIFPVIVACITLCTLAFAPRLLRAKTPTEDENVQLLKSGGPIPKRRMRRVNNKQHGS